MLREMLISFSVSGPRCIREKGKKTWLTYEKRLKRIQTMTRKYNERINERINDDINHNNGVII